MNCHRVSHPTRGNLIIKTPEYKSTDDLLVNGSQIISQLTDLPHLYCLALPVSRTGGNFYCSIRAHLDVKLALEFVLASELFSNSSLITSQLTAFLAVWSEIVVEPNSIARVAYDLAVKIEELYRIK